MSLITYRCIPTWMEATHTTHIANGHLGNVPRSAAPTLRYHEKNRKIFNLLVWGHAPRQVTRGS